MNWTRESAQRRALLATLGMVGAAGASTVLKPHQIAAKPLASLDDMVPKTFGTWRNDDQQAATVVNPSLQKILDTIYTDTLSRVYVGKNGERVMLALAYGQNQNRDLQVHKPEVCYVAQGFRLVSSEKVNLATSQGQIPAMRIVATMGSRTEPITYWIRVGDRVIRGWYEQNVARIELGFRGLVPDGLLVRASTIDDDRGQSFLQQQVFLSQMLAAIAPEHLPTFVGRAQA